MRTDLLVIGGGLAGLAAAERARRAGLEVRLLEAGSRVGGVVGSFTVEAERGGAFLFETGPHSVPGTARHVTAAIERLGLADRVVHSDAVAQKRYLLARGRLRALPASPLGLLSTSLVSWRTKLRFLGESRRAWTPPADGSEPTLFELVRDRFGADAATRVAGAFVRGVYAGEVDRLGARSAFPRLWAGLREHGSVLGFLKAARASGSGGGAARASLISFTDGMGELPAALARTLGYADARDGSPGGTIELGARVTALARTDDGWSARLADGGERRARAVVLAAPAPVATRLLEPLLARDDAAARALAELDTNTRANGVRLVHLGLAGPLPSGWPDGFGFLVPPDEARERDVRLLGTLVPSNVFAGRAPADGAAAACFYRLDDRTAAESPDATLAVARRELAAAIGAREGELDVVASRVLDWPSGAGGIPEYAPGHDLRVTAVEEAVARTARDLALAGSYTRGVSVDDVLARGERAASDLIERLASERPSDPGTS